MNTDISIIPQNLDSSSIIEPLTLNQSENLISDEYKSLLENHASLLNKYIPPINNNISFYNPGNSTLNYSPLGEKALEGIDKIKFNLENLGKEKPIFDIPKIDSVIKFGATENNFEHYYKHPKFSKLGWSPYANNEEYYNENSNAFDDFVRMAGQMPKLLKTGFVSSYRSIGDIIQGQPGAADLESAREFAKATNIGSSTRDGALGFSNNLILQFGYTLGMIANIAAEELALAYVTAQSGGTATPFTLPRFLSNIRRLGSTISNSFDVTRTAKATRELYRTMNNAATARDFYSALRGGGQFIGKLILPETFEAIKTLNSAKNGLEGLSSMAKVGKGFGGFYRDLRSLNYALSDSKMQSGFAYDEQISNGYDIKSSLLGKKELSPEEINEIVENADKAAFSRLLLNAPVIYLSNQLVLGNAFGSYNRSLARILREGSEGLSGKIINKGVRDSAGNLVRRPLEYVGDGFGGFIKKLKNAGVRGSFKSGAHASLRYFSANLAEGTQELYQEAVAKGVEEYYNSILKDPTGQNQDLLKTAIYAGLKSQMNTQGFEVFMSGFLMGGLANVSQNILFKGLPNLKNRIFDKNYKEKAANEENFIKSIVEQANDAYELTATTGLESIFDTNKINLVLQSQADADLLESTFKNSALDFIDAKDFVKFQAIYKVLDNNLTDIFRQQIKDYSKLTDTELEQAFSGIPVNDLRTRFEDMLSSIDKLEDSYNAHKDKFENIYKPNAFKRGTREWYNEWIKYKAFEHARYLALFTEDGFRRATARMNSIFTQLSNNSMFKDMKASDIVTLLNKESIEKEMELLSQEINVLKETKADNESLNYKQTKIKLLSNYLNSVNARKSEDSDMTPSYDSFVEYMNFISDNKIDSRNSLDDVFLDIYDYRLLEERAYAYAKSIEYLTNPKAIKDITERGEKLMREASKAQLQIFKDSIKSTVSVNEKNDLLNAIAQEDSFVDPDELMLFNNSNNVDNLTKFYDEQGLITPESNSEKYYKLKLLIDSYKNIQAAKEFEKTKPEQTEEKKETPKSNRINPEILEQIEDVPDVEIFNTESKNNPVLKKVLKEKYKQYVSKQLNSGEIPLSMDKWVDSEDAKKYIDTYQMLKKLWFKDLQKYKDTRIISSRYNSDSGFEEWIDNQQTNDIVRNVFFENETAFSDFIDITPSFNVENIDQVNKIVDDTFNTVQIIQIKTQIIDPDTNMPISATLYSVRDKKGQLLTEDKTSAVNVPIGATFDNINKARSAAKKLDSITSDATSFTFGGMEISYGSTVVDKNGKRYIVIGTPSEVEKGKKLFLLPENQIEKNQSKQDRNKLSKKVTEAEFKKDYKVEEFNFARVPENVSRLLIEEAVNIYPLENFKGTPVAEGFLAAGVRLQKILEILTPEERNKLALVVFRNEPEDLLQKKYQTRNPEGGLKEPNPFINRVIEPFAVGLKFGDKETESRINKILEENGINPSQHPDGIFAFVRTGSIQFVNEKGEVLNPLNLTEDIIKNTFTIYDRQKETALEKISNNFAIQQAFVNAVSDKMEGKNESTFLLSDFPEFRFNLDSSVNFKSSPKSVNELKHNTVDGVKVIVINDKLKNGTISTRYIIDIEDIDEREAFIEKLKSELASQPAVLNALTTEQRYMAVVKLPNGIYTAVPLKSQRLSEDQIFELGRELVTEGIRTINENLEGDESLEDKKIKDKFFNVEFNKEFNKKFYITTNIEGYTIEISANSDGTFRAELYDKKGKVVRARSYNQQGRQGTLDYQGEEKPDIIQLLLDNLQEGLKDYKKELETKKKKDATVEIPEWVNIKISINNVRGSFPEGVAVDSILDNTVTTLDENIRTNYRLRLSADANAIEEVKLFDATIKVIPVVSPDSKIVEQAAPVSIDAKQEGTNKRGSTYKTETKEKDGIKITKYIETNADGKKITLGGRVMTLEEFIKDYNVTDQEDLDNLEGATEVVVQEVRTNKEGKQGITIRVSFGTEKMEINVKGSEVPSVSTDTKADKERRRQEAYEQNGLTQFAYQAKLQNITLEEELQNRLNNEIRNLEYLKQNNEVYDVVRDTEKRKEFFEEKLKVVRQIDAELDALEQPPSSQAAPVSVAVVSDESKGDISFADIKTMGKGALQKEVEQNRSRIRAIEEEIDTNEPDMIKASELIEDNEERAKLLARNREIEKKLMANKIIGENLTEQEVADIDEFVIWANNNLPDFISVEDISNLRDNLVTNGVRVGAFALSLSGVAGGMKIKGTLYTGAKSPYKYHEAFHAVFRSLLSNQQQDKLYKIAEAELRRKLGDKFEEELEKFRNSANQYKEMSRARLEKEFYEEYMADEFEKFKKDPRSTKTDSAIKNFFNRIIEWIKALFGVYTPYQLQDLFREIDAGKFKSASAINNRFTDSLANGITVANKIIPVETIQSETGQFGYRTLDNNFARSIVSSISARVIMLEQENKNAKFNIKKAVNQSFALFKNLYSTKREAYRTMSLTPEQRRNLRDLEKAFTEYGDFIKDAVYDELKFYDIKSKKIEEDLEDIDEQVGDRLRTTDQYDKDVTSIGGFSSLSTFLRKYIGTTPVSEKDEFGNDYLVDPQRDENGEIIPGTGEKILVTVDFATAYNGFLKAVKNITDPVKILQQLYFFGINNSQTKAVVDRLFADLNIQWEGQLENGELPVYTSEVLEKFKAGLDVTPEERNQGIKRPLLLQAVLKGFENARVDYLFIHRTSGDQVYTYTAANRDDAHTQIDRWGQAYIEKSKRLRSDDGVIKVVADRLDKLLNRLQFVGETSTQTSLKTLTDTKLMEFAQETSRILQEYVGITLSPKFIEFSIAKNIERPTKYQKALLNANSNEKALDYVDIREIKKIIEAKQNLFSDTDEGARNRLKRIALGNAAFDENIGASVFKNPNGDLVYAHQLPSFHLKQMESLNDVAGNGAKIDELKESDDYLINNFLLNSEAFKQLSAEGRIRILRIAGSKIGPINIDEDGFMSESSGRTPNSGKTYGDSTPREFILNLINAYTYAIDSKTGKVNGVSWENADGVTEFAALAPVLLRVLEASNTGDMSALPVFRAVEKNDKGETVITNEALNAFINNIAAEFARIQKESNPETATQELHVGYNAIAIPNAKTGTEEIIPINVESGSVNKARAFNFHKTGVILSPLGQKKESRQGVVTIQTSEIKLERIEKGEQSSIVYDQKTAENIIGFTSTGVIRDVVVKTKEGEKVVPKKIIGRGLVRVTPENRERIFEALKGSISRVKNDQFKYEVRVGSKKFYVESINEQQFLQGRKPMYMYDIMSAEEYDIAEEIAVMIGGFDAEGYLDKLTQAARSPEFANLTFTEALQKLNIKEGELKRFLSYRLNQEFNEFNIALDELIGDQGGLGTFLNNGIQTANGAVTAETRRSARYLNIIPEDKGYNLRQIFFNDYINTTAINQILLGDTAYSLKDAVDEIKRAKAQAASYYSAASTVPAPEYGIFKPLQELSIFELTEPIVNATHNKGGEIKNADAQLWMTTKAFRNFQYGFGKLTPTQAELFNKVERGENISPEDIFGTEEESGYAKRQEMLNSQKLVYADGETFVKMSAFPLLPQFTSIKDENGEYTIPKPNKIAIHNLRIKLEAFEKENDTVAVAAPRSALKMMQKNVSNIHSITSNTTPLTKEQSVTLNANFLGLQVINPSNKTVITDPTQIKSLVTSEQDDAVEVIINGQKLTLGQVRAAYHKATRNRGNLNYINKRNLVFSFDVEYAMDQLHKSIKENAITADLYTYLRYAEASLSSTGSSSHLMELFSVDSAGNPKYNLNNPLTYDKFLSLFMSYFSKSVFSEKVPGATVSLVSDYGVRVYRRVFSVDENGMPDRHEVITEAQYEAMADKPEILFNIDEGSYPGNDDNLIGLADEVKKGKGVVIIDRLRNDLKEYDAKGVYTGQKYGEMILPSHHKEVMAELQLKGKSIPDVVGKMFGVRIPSQDNHSTYNVKWVDFMPAAYGSSGVFARELIEISGADFDIDKLYMQFKEFYEKNGEFFEYGKADTIDKQYLEYIRYINQKVKDSDSIYGEALYKYNNKGVGKNLSINKTDFDTAKSRGFKEESINALLVLGMPVTLKDYKAYKEKFKHEPYSAAINNDILDYKFALMGNDHVTERKPLFLDKNGNTTTVNTGKPALDENGVQKTAVPISYESADMEVLKDLWDELKTELPEWAALAEEEGIDVDNLFGKLRMFANNKEGSRSIGAVVLPNLYLNLLQEYDVKIASERIAGVEILPQIEFGGVTFRDFKNTYELYENGSQGQRTQYIISALITAATDNAKERLLAKLGLNINALSVVANLVALGVPVKTSVLLVNHPVIRNAYFQEANSSEDESIRAVEIVEDRIANLKTAFVEVEDRNKRTRVDQNILMQAIETPLIKPTATAGDMAELRESGEVDTISVLEEISILEQFLNAAKLANTTRYMGDLLNLTAGLGQGIEAIDKRNTAIEKLALNLSDKDYKALGENKPMIDARSIFKGDTWQAGYLQRFEEFTNILLPKVVLSANPLFRSITNEIISQTTINRLPVELRDKSKNKVAKDFLSYLTIKAYMHNGMVNNSQSIATLTNGLIYNQEGIENIVSVVERMRKTEAGKNNYFLNSFIITERANLSGNKTGLNLAGSNTFLRYNDSQKVDIQNGFMTLYADPLTRADAMALVHYMMVKDGLQYGYKSLVESAAPIALDRYLNQVDTVQAAIERTNDTLFLSTFGLDLDNLIIDFIQGYLTSAPNAYILKKVRATIYSPIEREIQIIPKFTREIASQNPEAIYVYGDNATKQGSIGNSSIRNLNNAFSLVLKKDINKNEESFYPDSELGTFIDAFDAQVEQLLNMITDGKEVIFPKELISDLKTFKENSPSVFDYVRAKLKQEFNYEIDPKAKPTKDEKKEIKLANTSILRLPVYVSLGEVSRLVVDLYAGIARVDRKQEASSIRNIPAAQKLNAKVADKFEKNIKFLKKAGFRNLTGVKKGADTYKEVEFPLVIRQDVGSNFKPEYKYYILSNVQSLFPGKTILNINNKAVGSYAEYIEVDIKGSMAQNPIGFMFGERPTTKQIRSFISNLSDSINEDFLPEIYDDFDIENVEIPFGAEVMATEKGITVDGKNIKDLVKPTEETPLEVASDFDMQEALSDFETYDIDNAIDISTNDFFKNLLADNNAPENKYPELTTWWDENINNPYSQEALNNRNTLKSHRNNPEMKFKVSTLEDFIEMFENSEFTSEQEFLNHFNNCYL